MSERESEAVTRVRPLDDDGARRGAVRGRRGGDGRRWQRQRGGDGLQLRLEKNEIADG